MICCIFNSKDDASFTIQTLETFQNHTISYNHNDLKKKWRIQKEKIGLFPILGCIPSATELSGRPRQLLSSLQLLAVHFLLSQAQSKYELATSPLQDAGTWTLFPVFRTLKFLVSSSIRAITLAIQNTDLKVLSPCVLMSRQKTDSESINSERWYSRRCDWLALCGERRSLPDFNQIFRKLLQISPQLLHYLSTI